MILLACPKIADVFEELRPKLEFITLKAPPHFLKNNLHDKNATICNPGMCPNFIKNALIPLKSTILCPIKFHLQIHQKHFFVYKIYTFFINPIKNLSMYGNEDDQVTSRRKRQLKFQMYKKKQFHALFFSILSPQLFLFLSLFSLIAIWRFTFQNVSNFFFTIISYFFTTLGVVASDKESKRYLIAVNYALLICNWKRIHEVNENVALVVNNFFFKPFHISLLLPIMFLFFCLTATISENLIFLHSFVC